MMDRPPDIQILFVDTALLVVNKPAGLSTLPDGYNPSLPHIKSLLERRYARLWIVHRLDKETSGVLLLARSAEAHRSLNTQFEQRLVSKIYHAVVTGRPEWREKTVDLPLRPNGDRQHRTVVDPSAGKPAVTHFQVMERFKEACLLAAIPETGRTHQIRAHLSVVGMYIIGDKLYGRKSSRPIGEEAQKSITVTSGGMSMFEGMALHALSLEISHPLTGEKMTFTAPYPVAMEALIQQLRLMEEA